VNDPAMTGLARQLYEHAAINPRGPSASAAGAATQPLKNKPAYIDKQQFAMALLDLTGLSAASAGQGAQPAGPGAVAALTAALNTALPGTTNPQIRQLLLGIIQRAQGDIGQVEKAVADWFDSAMDRVGGAFKRWTQLASVIVALAVAMLLNVNTLQLGQRLWEQPTLAAQLNAPASWSAASQAAGPAASTPPYIQTQEKAASEAVAFLDASLPVGWQGGHILQINTGGKATGPWEYWWTDAAGWALFGAPFWFDALQTVVRLKGAGPSPSEKADGRAASA
jgi:hypothetical protein